MGGPLVDGVVCVVGKHVRVRRRAPVRGVGVARRREAAEALLEDIRAQRLEGRDGDVQAEVELVPAGTVPRRVLWLLTVDRDGILGPSLRHLGPSRAIFAEK